MLIEPYIIVFIYLRRVYDDADVRVVIADREIVDNGLGEVFDLDPVFFADTSA